MSYTSKKYPLITEPHPESYNGYPFMTLLTYGNEKILTIVDNHNKHSINAFVLDYCNIENLNEDMIIRSALNWYNDETINYPISIAFAKNPNLGTHKIYKSFNINYVKRIIGPLPIYNMETIKKIKRKKKKISDTNIKISYNSGYFWSEGES